LNFSEDNKTAYVTREEFDELLEYSCSLPTGTTLGKRWKRDNNSGTLRPRPKDTTPDWYLGEYYMDETIPEGEVGIRWRKLVIGEKTEGDSVSADEVAPGSNQFPPDALSAEERERIYNEGRTDYRAGKFFHEGPYAKSGDVCSDEDYRRGYEWRRGWNDEALDDGAANLGKKSEGGAL